MADLRDETLMAYADGELAPADRAEVEALLRRDPAARKRLDVFVATRAPLAAQFDRILAEPVPARLFELAQLFPTRVASQADTAPRQTARSGILDALRQAVTSVGWQGALAYSAVLLTVGAGAGWVLRDVPSAAPGNNLLAMSSNGRIVATGPLAQALETARGGVPLEASDGNSKLTVMPRATFASKQGYCRQYDLTTATSSAFAGVGCRGADGQWTISLHMPAPASAPALERPRLSSAPAVVAHIEQLIEGDAFGSEQEQTIMERGWKR